ncbi:hypothetical protein [Chondromyces crocatus]|uniref:Uncharacterized protein n=1 Tax=Chondromyces crocatus TaxID=52 RepID=A0A0K1EEQ7_CHOCO|nr:hypothetical protein [Chondromyces crocatus]AKT39167.1 uncharacterized protein CMC5_033140 [Chondromyces crocatus]
MDYEPGDPIPQGYALATRPSRALGLAGLLTLGTPYLFSLTVATITLLSGEQDGRTAPLLIPVAGPFIAIETLGAERAGAFWLAADGVMQTLGVLLLAAAFAHEDVYLKRQGHASRETALDVALRPEVQLGFGGGSVRWQF